MNRGIMKIDAELLIAALHLPEDTKIIDVRKDFDSDDVHLVVEHPDIRDVPPGNLYYPVNPRLTRVFAVPEKIVFDGWGQ